jgi:hypothetical protein
MFFSSCLRAQPHFLYAADTGGAIGGLFTAGPDEDTVEHWAKVNHVEKYLPRLIRDKYVVPKKGMMPTNKPLTDDALNAVVRYRREDRGQAPPPPLTANSQLKTPEQTSTRIGGILPEVFLPLLPEDCIAVCPATAKTFVRTAQFGAWWPKNAQRVRLIDRNFRAQKSADKIAADAQVKSEQQILAEGAAEEQQRLATALASSREKQSSEAAARRAREHS